MPEQNVPPAPYRLGPDEGPAWWFLGNLVTVKAGGENTHGALTVAEFVNPPGFGPPLHRHLNEDEMFYILAGKAEFSCAGVALVATVGDFILLPKGEPHTFLVADDEPLRALQLTTPAGFETFAAVAGASATERRLPDPAPVDPAALGHIAALHGIEILGPPPGH
jgi:mannose-6-phosphate isomerase-like protein (cupin superfamily)